MATYELITILGPTATGKTAFAAALARRLGSEIISADSRQVYRGMDIGTGKDLGDYCVDGVATPYHLIDVCEAGERYNVFAYQRDFFRVYDRLRAAGMIPILCGGSGLYIEAVLKGYRMWDVPQNPVLRKELRDKPLTELERILATYRPLHNTTDTDTVNRAIRAIEIADYYARHATEQSEYAAPESLIIGLDIGRELRRERISQRLRRRLDDDGMVDEVRRLLDSGLTPDDLIYYGLEYKYVTLYLTGRLNYSEMTAQLETAIHRFAKRQMTWFRGMERRGFVIRWLDALLPTDEKIERTLELLYSK